MIKRLFDLFFSVGVLLSFSWLFLLVWLTAAISTNSSGLFFQPRIGRFGNTFTIYKFRTMFEDGSTNRISRFLRRSKLDELPQIINVLFGTMSFVGPRPDISGYYDKLTGEQQKILELRPGITSEASIKYKNEETLLSTQVNPAHFNDTVIFPDKVRMNLDYYYNRTFMGDMAILYRTIVGRSKR